MSTAAKESKVALVVPWGIEADHPRNSDLLIQCIPNCRLRSAIKASRSVKDWKTGEELVPQDQARHLGQLPPLPGMQLFVDPAKGTYKIVDPLHGDEELCERLTRRIKSAQLLRTKEKLAGVPPQEGKLDKDRMKSLCREMLNIVDAGEAQVVAGPKPDREDVDELPGEYLLNPGSRVESGQPLYEKDLDEYRRQVNVRG